MTSQTSKSKPKPQKFKVTAVKEPVVQQLLQDGTIAFDMNNIYNAPVVFVFCSFDEFQTLCKNMYKGATPPKAEASGYTLFGDTNISGATSLVWVNSDTPLMQTIPTFVHEICHAADNILANANVKDEDGEAKAYLVEWETRVVLSTIFAMSFNNLTKEKFVDMMSYG